jgi:hypothetical protein
MTRCTSCKLPYFARIVRDYQARNTIFLEIIFKGQPCCDRVLERFHEELNTVYLEKKRMKLLYDARLLGYISPLAIPEHVRRMKKHDSQNKQFGNNIAVVFSKSLPHKIISSCLSPFVDSTSKRIFLERGQAIKWLNN